MWFNIGRNMNLNEADARAKLVDPQLRSSHWDGQNTLQKAKNWKKKFWRI